MTSIQSRVDMAARWFQMALAIEDDGTAGWGWVRDVAPNPQNTAEVVCAMQIAGIEFPQPEAVEKMVRQGSVVTSYRGRWVFQEMIDFAWRLRALRVLGAADDDPDVAHCVTALVNGQDPSGGWRMSGDGPVSITATSMAIASMSDQFSVAEAECMRRGLAYLTDALLANDERFEQTFASAYAAFALTHAGTYGGRRLERARSMACANVLEYLGDRRYLIEEEATQRAGSFDSWRHLTLSLSLRAIATAAPHELFNPSFRNGLIVLMDLQETRENEVSLGGFRTSPEGFVTSYATTQALEVLAAIRRDLDDRVSPAVSFDLLCRRDSEHHTDPQTVLSVGGRSIIMNSTAGLFVMIVCLIAGLGMCITAAAVHRQIDNAASRTLLSVGCLIAALGLSSYFAVRLHKMPKSRIALTLFTLFTALILPIVTFVLS